MSQTKPNITLPHALLSEQPLSAAGSVTANKVVDRFGEQLRAGDNPHEKRYLHLTVPVEETDQLAWLRTRKSHPRFYWRSRDNDLEVAAVGTSRAFEAANRDQLCKILDDFDLSSVMPAAANLPGAYLVAPFDLDSDVSGTKQNRAMLIVPQLQLVRLSDKYFLTVNLTEENSKQSRTGLNRLGELLSASVEDIAEFEGGSISAKIDIPDRDRWGENVDAVLQAMSDGRVSKVVLARKTTLELEREVDSFAFLARLRGLNPTAFAFMFEPDSSESFIGVSPERLLRIVGNELTTEAIAGTTARGKTKEEDERLAGDLLHSRKNLSEQRFVVEAVRGAVEKYCVDVPPETVSPELLKLSRVQHLISRFTGTLREPVRLGELFSHLYPTPAVCGTPRREALQLIRSLDGFDRGWYAGGVGVIGPEIVEFAVSIRSMYLRRNQLSLFAGAGIVPGSNPALEWKELDQKLATVLAVLEDRIPVDVEG